MESSPEMIENDDEPPQEEVKISKMDRLEIEKYSNLLYDYLSPIQITHLSRNQIIALLTDGNAKVCYNFINKK
jgi:hypothetical protein